MFDERRGSVEKMLEMAAQQAMKVQKEMESRSVHLSFDATPEEAKALMGMLAEMRGPFGATMPQGNPFMPSYYSNSTLQEAVEALKIKVDKALNEKLKPSETPIADAMSADDDDVIFDPKDLNQKRGKRKGTGA